MKKLIIIGLAAAFMLACTAPEISENEYEEYGTKKSESVNTEGNSDKYEYDNSED